MNTPVSTFDRKMRNKRFKEAYERHRTELLHELKILALSDEMVDAELLKMIDEEFLLNAKGEEDE